jgi:hypothetical protein
MFPLGGRVRVLAGPLPGVFTHGVSRRWPAECCLTIRFTDIVEARTSSDQPIAPL